MRIAAFAIVVATVVVATSSCVVPLAGGDQNCATYCGLLQSCGSAGAPQGDCGAWCSAMDTQNKHVGCKAQFDDATACIAGEASCTPATCDELVAAYTDCTAAFCTANPSDSACPSSG